MTSRHSVTSFFLYMGGGTGDGQLSKNGNERCYTPTLPQPCSDCCGGKVQSKQKRTGNFRANSVTQSDVALKGEITSNGEMDIIPAPRRLNYMSS